MMALVFGDEKRANPNPSTARMNMSWIIGVLVVRKLRVISPITMIPMPKEESFAGSIVSERLPAYDEKTAWITGCVTRMKPAS
jgi:hypothetical protein